MVRIGGAGVFLCAVAVAIAGCTVSVTTPPSAPAQGPFASPGPSQSPRASSSRPTAATASPQHPATSAEPAAAGGLPGSWTRSADLLAIDSEPEVTTTSDGGFLAVVADSRRVLRALRSTDGQAWTEITAPVEGSCGPTATCGATPSGLAANPQTLVMTGRDESMGVAAIWTSMDGKLWTRVRTMPDLRRGELSGLVRTPRGFAAVVNWAAGTTPSISGVVLGSADGQSWTVAWMPLPAGVTQGSVSAVIASGTGYVAVGSLGQVPTAWSSRDGRTWTAATLAGQKDIGFGGCLSARDGKVTAFVPVDIWQRDTTNAFRWVSADSGVTWTAGGSGPGFDAVRSVLSTASGLVAIGRSPSSQPGGGSPIWTSADGATWTPTEIGGAARRPNDIVTSIAESAGRIVVTGLTDIDKGTATGSDASAYGRLVIWVGGAAAVPTLAMTPGPSPTAAASPLPGASPTAQPMPHLAPDVEALVPAKIGSTPYAVGSLLVPIERDLAGGDMCFLFCDGEVGGWARKLGIDSGLASIAYAVPERATGGPAAVVFALRLPGPAGVAPIADAKLENAWVVTHATSDYGGLQGASLTLGGKRVRLSVVSLLNPDLNRYVYAHAGTLYLVGIYTAGGLPDPTKPGELADEVFAALP